MDNTYQTFHVGINVFVVKNKQLLLGKRKNVYGTGTWSLLGGHLEVKEAMKDAARRELKEETGLKAESFDFVNIVNDRSRNEHYLQVGFVAHGISGNPVVKEPERCEEWRWFDFDELPKDIFPAHSKQIEIFFKDLRFSDS